MKANLRLSGHAVIRIDLPNVPLAETLFQALTPETSSAPSDRAQTSLSLEGNELVLEFEAGDLTSLRAAMNSYLAWISGSMKTIDLLDIE